MKLVGRISELEQIHAGLTAHKNILLEGPVGAGKTHLALAVTAQLKRSVFRVDGDQRFSEHKMTGWFDPPLVLKKGYGKASFVPGPLAQAMTSGGVLFINELNRLPEGVQNVLLPAIDERILVIPRLGEIKAKDGFCVIATQNPKEFVATSHLSEAILDRFELISVDYPSRSDEEAIVAARFKKSSPPLIRASVELGRLTRNHPKIRRGASIRAAISIAEIASAYLALKRPLEEAFLSAACMALPTRIEFELDSESEMSRQEQIRELIEELARAALEFDGDPASKKA
jgi:MoxR-like ATPase